MQELDRRDPGRYFSFIIGNGPLEGRMKSKAIQKGLNNVCFTGALSMAESGKILLNSDVVFIPGMTGLSIVHSFCYGLPYVTFDLDIHSPEIEYLINKWNGLITTSGTYINDIYNLLCNDVRLIEMKKNALSCVNNLTVEKQVSGFKNAIDYVFE